MIRKILPPAWRRTDVAAGLLIAALIVAGIALAAITRSPGWSDAPNNLDTARNIATGQGFTTHLIQELFSVQSIPVREQVRPPAMPYLLALFFWLFGVHLSIPVLLSVAVVAASAVLLYLSVRDLAGPREALLCLFLFVVSDRFDLISYANNNFLVLYTLMLLYLGLRVERRTVGRAPLTLLLVLITASGFYVKSTILLLAGPASLWMLLHAEGAPGTPRGRRAILASIAVYGLAVCALLAPFLIDNYLRTGDPMFHPWRLARLANRYRILEWGQWWTERFGRPVTYGEVIQSRGWLGLLGLEGYAVALGVARTLRDNFGLLLAAGALTAWHRAAWSRYTLGLLALLCVEPLFVNLFYWRYEEKYVWPLTVVLAVYFTVTLHSAGGLSLRGLARRSRRVAVWVLLGLAILTNGVQAGKAWRDFLWLAQLDPPPWVAVLEQTPPETRILTDNPSPPAWYLGRLSIVAPAGDRQGLLNVLRVYKPDYHLWTAESGMYFVLTGERGSRADDTRFLEDELIPVASGGPDSWQVYRINKDAEALRPLYGSGGG